MVCLFSKYCQRGRGAVWIRNIIFCWQKCGWSVQFNFLFVFQGDGTFGAEDYQKIARAEQIRNASDYDDFYVANKEETRQQVANAEYIIEKISDYMRQKEMVNFQKLCYNNPQR